jgi:hypothetical protein
MSLFTGLINAASQAVKALKGKPSITDVAGQAIGLLSAGVTFWSEFEGADAETRIRSAWDEFDARSGIDGPDVIRDLPPEAEERLFDGIKAAGLELSLWAAGVYGDKPGPEAVSNAVASLSVAVANPFAGFDSLVTPAKETTSPPTGSPGDAGSEADKADDSAAQDDAVNNRIKFLEGELILDLANPKRRLQSEALRSLTEYALLLGGAIEAPINR